MKEWEESFAEAHILMLKMINDCFEYIEWCFQIFKEFVDIFL